MCKQHNAYLAERDYGKDVMERYRKKANRVSERGELYGLWKNPILDERNSGRAFGLPGGAGGVEVGNAL